MAQNPDKWGISTQYEAPVVLLKKWVDFHWEVDGKLYDFSIPGGGYVSFTDLVDQLGIAGEDEGEDTGDAAQAFVANVASVAFSSPELLWVGKADTGTTVGALKEANGLTCEYSADLTEEQIEDINSTAVESGDWALISMQPFSSTESLTVAMNTGEVFEIRVTDASYIGTQITDLDGKTGALVNVTNRNAVQDTVTNGNLNAVDVTIDTNTNTITTNDNTSLTQWTFIKVPDTQNSYYIKSDAGYLHINDNPNGSGVGTVSISPTEPQALTVTSNSANRIRIVHGNNNALNNIGHATVNGYGTWNGQNGGENPGEWFTFYELQEKPIVTLHFGYIDDSGNWVPLEGFTYNGTEITGSTYDVTAEWAESEGTIDLKDFVKSGYTLSNTHKSTYKDINNSSDSYTHSIIGNELRWRNGTVQYRLFYTNHDKAGSHWFDAGTEPRRDPQYWQYNYNNSNSDPTVYTAVPDNDANPYDYYLVYSPVPGASGSTGGQTPSGGDLDDIGKSKTLTPNGDGTYTMDLSVTTHATGHEQSNGINLIIVFDTSSSMRRSVNDANTQ